MFANKLLKTVMASCALVTSLTTLNAAHAEETWPQTAPKWEDFYAVTSVAYNFADALDHRNWAQMRACLDDQVHTDSTRAGNQDAAETVSGDDMVWHIRIQETGFEGTELLLGNPLVKVNGNKASMMLAFYGEHIAAIASGENWYTIGGYQHFELEKKKGRWVVTGFRLSPTWTKGNRDVMAIGIKRGIERVKAEGAEIPPSVLKMLNWTNAEK